MNNIRRKIIIKVISLILTIGIFWQTSGWADSGGFAEKTLQGRTLFTDPDSAGSFAPPVNRYVNDCLLGIENEPKNQNTELLKLIIKQKLRKLKDKLANDPEISENMKKMILELIPNSEKIRSNFGVVELDLGECTIRYSNHNLPDFGIEIVEEKTVLQKKKGRYLTKQVFIRDNDYFSGKSKDDAQKYVITDKYLTEENLESRTINLKKEGFESFQKTIPVAICYNNAYKFFNEGSGKKALKVLKQASKHLDGIEEDDENVRMWRKRIEDTRETIGIIMSPNSRKNSYRRKLRMLNSTRKHRKHKMEKADRYPGPRFGPALFVDPDTGELRELNDEPDESGRISEHEAVNEALNELVFDSEQTPFKSGNTLYDFVQEGFDGKISMYRFDREELKEKLSQKGYPRLAEGLITHAGTYRGPRTGEERAYNIFIPDSVYDLLTEFLERKNEMKIADNLLEFWAAHELLHLSDREYLRTFDNFEYKKEVSLMADMILYLSLEIQALKKKEFKQALKYADNTIEKVNSFAFPFELKGRVYEAMKNQRETIVNYIIALSKINKENSKTMKEHSLEDKILSALASGKKKTHFFKKIKKLRLFMSPERNIFSALYVFFEMKRKGNIVNEESCASEQGAANAVLSFGVIPIMCGYLDKALKEKSGITSFEIEVVEKLLDVVSKNEVLGSRKANCLKISDFTLARIYRLAERVYDRKGDYDKAIKYNEFFLNLSKNMPTAYLEKASLMMNREPGMVGIDKAEEILKEAKEKFGPMDIFDEMEKNIEKEKLEIYAAEERKREFKETYFWAKLSFENGKYKECMDLLSEIEEETGGSDINENPTKLKKKAHSITKLWKRAKDAFDEKAYEKAMKITAEILEKNPYDLKAIRFEVKLLDILENEKLEKDKLEIARKCLNDAKEACVTANNQVASGRIERARHNYTKAKEMLLNVSSTDEIQNLIAEINAKLEKIKNLPNIVKKRPLSPQKTAKKKKNRIKNMNAENSDKKNSPENGKNENLKCRKLNKICLSEQAVCMLMKIERAYRNAILKDIHQVADGKKKNVKKIEPSKNCKRIRTGDHRVVYAIYNSETMLICDVESKSTIKYNKVVKQYDDLSIQVRILGKSITIEEFEKKLSSNGKKKWTLENKTPFVNDIKAIYGKFGESDSVPNGGRFNESISLLALPRADNLRKKVHSVISKEIPSDAEVLAVGVGTGAFERLFGNVTGIDITPEPLRMAGKRGINTINIDGNKPDFWDDVQNKLKFDAVFVSESIGYFELDKIFKRIKKVLKPGGRIYILTSPGSEKKQNGYREFNRDDVMHELGLSGFIEIRERNFSYWAGAVRMISAKLPVENDNSGTRKRSLRSFFDEEKIEENTRETAPCLVQGLIDSAVSASVKNEKVMLYLDEVLTDSDEGKISEARERLFRALVYIEDNNEELALFLKNKLEIRSGTKEEFAAKMGKINPENIIVVTNKANLEAGSFSHVDGKGVIAAIDDTAFSKKAYKPLLGPVLLAVGKYLKWDEKMPKKFQEFYEKIPNAISIHDLNHDEYANLFGKDSKTIIINLIPDATEFDTQEHVEVIECVRDILSKA
ncbi:MAG: class I SAM-dependent methyltransferase [Candidatus Omnitrophica bacterium]|nr:class I SAM-dependent methyltransferase [Candidatus Omnitrophota bacterium]